MNPIRNDDPIKLVLNLSNTNRLNNKHNIIWYIDALTLVEYYNGYATF